jgi:salicylate hydroxylase
VVVIGCDGINSTMRKVILGADEPASHPTYSHNVAYRTVVPVADASSALGQDKANSPCMHLGPDAVIVSYPVCIIFSFLMCR